MSRGDSKEKAIMEAAPPKPPLAIPPHSKLRGFLAFSREFHQQLTVPTIDRWAQFYNHSLQTRTHPAPLFYAHHVGIAMGHHPL